MFETIGERLQQARKDAKLSQGEVCNLLGIPKVQTLSAYERNVNNPPLETLARLAMLYHVSIDWIVYGGEKQLSSVKSKVDYIVDLFKSLDELGVEIIEDYGENDYGIVETTYLAVLKTNLVGFKKLVEAVYKLKGARPHLEGEDYDAIIMKKIRRIAKESNNFETFSEQYNRENGISE